MAQPLPGWWMVSRPASPLTLRRIGRETLHASYLHVHWAGYPELAQRFADAVHDHAGMRSSLAAHSPHHAQPSARSAPAPSRTVSHRKRSRRSMIFTTTETATLPKAWSTWPSTSACPLPRIGSAQSSTAPPSTSPRTPTPTRQRKAIAEAHGVTVDQVLPTAGGAEAFTLLARAFRPERPLIIHPQFTEPEAALLAAGHQPQRLILSPATGFRLDAGPLPADADLVVIGNPTNPTSVLHPRGLINSLRRAERIVVVDEAFMDAVPGETETMIGDDLTGC